MKTATCPISNGNPDIVIDADASLIGWGLFVTQLQHRVVLQHQMFTMLRGILMCLNF